MRGIVEYHAKNAYNSGKKQIMRKEITPEQFEADLMHNIWRGVADELGLEYTREPWLI